MLPNDNNICTVWRHYTEAIFNFFSDLEIRSRTTFYITRMKRLKIHFIDEGVYFWNVTVYAININMLRILCLIGYYVPNI